MLRVISGQYRGKKLKADDKKIRPTMAKVREALFNILRHSEMLSKSFGELSFLDLFAGSGSVSIEALSRGFTNVTAVDIDTKCIRQNLEDLSISEIQVLDRNILALGGTIHQYDVAFIDPHYQEERQDSYSKVVNLVLHNLHKYSWLSQKAVVVLEKSSKSKIDINNPNFELIQQRTYGMSELVFLSYS